MKATTRNALADVGVGMTEATAQALATVRELNNDQHLLAVQFEEHDWKCAAAAYKRTANYARTAQSVSLLEEFFPNA